MIDDDGKKLVILITGVTLFVCAIVFVLLAIDVAFNKKKLLRFRQDKIVIIINGEEFNPENITSFGDSGHKLTIETKDGRKIISTNYTFISKLPKAEVEK